MNNLELPSRLVSLRGALGMTQKQLGKKIGRSHNTIMNWEKGNTPFPREMASVFGELLNVNPSWLLFGEGEMFIEPLGRNLCKVQILTFAGLGHAYTGAEGLIGGEDGAEEEGIPLEFIFLTKDLITCREREIKTAVCCKGDSMYPTIVDGGLAGIDFDDREPVENRMFLFHFPYLGFSIKRLQMGEGGYRAVSDNKMVRGQPISRDDIEQGVIIGSVGWIYNKV